MASVYIRPRRLLEHAQELVQHHEAQGRPRTIWLRRAVSAAYYAVFHAISLEAVLMLAPDSSREDRFRLSRSVNHGDLVKVCGWIRGQGSPEHAQPIVDRLRQDSDMRQLAEIISGLQEQRHRADYDHLASFPKATALHLTAQAARAFEILNARRGSLELQEFFALILLTTPRVR